MNKFGVATTAVIFAGSASIASAQATLEQMVDLFEAAITAEGGEISYDDRNVSGDGSVEYQGFSLTDPEGEVTIATEFLKGTPDSSDPNLVTFTVGEEITVKGKIEDEVVDYTILTDDFSITTNGLFVEVNDLTEVIGSLSADKIEVTGGDPNSNAVRALDITLEEVDFSGQFSMLNEHASGSMTIGQSDAYYDITIDGQTQTADQQIEFSTISFDFDTPASEEEAMLYLNGAKNGSFVFESGKQVFEGSMTQDGMTMVYAGNGDAGRGEISIVDGLLTYDIQQGAVNFDLDLGGMAPVPPVEIAMTEMVFKLLLPLNSADAAETAIVDIQLRDLLVGEGLWSMVDPGQTIPRDPANIVIDLDADVQVDALSAAISGVENPFEAAKVNNLNINEILLSIGGAMVQSEGALTIDNSGFFPMPNGSIDIAISGLQGLSEKLVALGLVDNMQVGMMMGMIMAYSQPDGDDKFTSEITFSEEGIFANGQPLQ